jgi:hypothetical protein
MQAPDVVVAGVGGHFTYDWVFVADVPFVLDALGWANLSNTGPYDVHADCFCDPTNCATQIGDTLRWRVYSTLVDSAHIGRVVNYVAPCGPEGGGSSTTTILPRGAILPTTHLDAPNGGEQWIVGLPIKITWTATGNALINLYVDRYGVDGRFSESRAELIAEFEDNDGTYDWVVTGPGTNADTTHVYSALFRVEALRSFRGDPYTTHDDSDTGVSLFDSATGTLVALFEAEPLESGVELRWQLGRAEQLSDIAVERSESEVGPWTRLAGEPRDVDGVKVLTDRTVDHGKLYHYRLVGTTSGGRSMTLAQLSVRAGVAIAEFELLGAGPNPGHGPVGIDYAVPREARVCLTVVDLQGRRVARLAEGTFPPGRYHAEWSGELERGGPAPAGVYFIRYQAPGKDLVRRIVIAR